MVTVLTGQMTTLNYGGSEWLVKSDPATKRWYASERIAELASEYWGTVGSGASSPAQPVRSQPGYNVVFIYNTKEPNLFTPQILESIRQVSIAHSGFKFGLDCGQGACPSTGGEHFAV